MGVDHPHDEMSIDSATGKLMAFGVMINRKLHGQNFHKKPRNQHTSFIAFIEHIDSNLHFHAVLTTSECEGFDKYAAAIWTKLVEAGSLHIESGPFLKTDARKIAIYITKELKNRTNSECYVPFS